MKKRVLQLIGSFHSGGSERQAVALTRQLCEAGGFDVFAATLNKSGVLLDTIATVGFPEIPEFRLTSFYNPNFVRQVRRCSAYLREHQIDIVHTHDFYTNIFGMAAASLANVPVKIASKRETGGMRSTAQNLIEKQAFARADAVVVNSEAVRQYLVSRRIVDPKLNLIYNGLDMSRFDVGANAAERFRRSIGIAQDDKVVTLVANLRHAVKNVPMLLRAAANVADAHFVIAGEGELESKLRALATSLGVASRIHFIGRCNDIPAVLAASNICVLTSTNEGFSNSILEYMAAGKPVVATKVGGAAEAVIDGETGFLVDSDDDVALAERLISLLADGESATKFGRRGREIVESKFSVGSQLDKTVELYSMLLTRAR